MVAPDDVGARMAMTAQATGQRSSGVTWNGVILSSEGRDGRYPIAIRMGTEAHESGDGGTEGN